jgi:hypothetical protein
LALQHDAFPLHIAVPPPLLVTYTPRQIFHTQQLLSNEATTHLTLPHIPRSPCSGESHRQCLPRPAECSQQPPARISPRPFALPLRQYRPSEGGSTMRKISGPVARPAWYMSVAMHSVPGRNAAVMISCSCGWWNAANIRSTARPLQPTAQCGLHVQSR